MEANRQNITTAHAMRLRIGVSVFAGANASGNGHHTAAVGSNTPSRGLAGAGEQRVGIPGFRNRRGRIGVPSACVEKPGAQKAPGFFVAWRHNK